jgi:hypothetical protein
MSSIPPSVGQALAIRDTTANPAPLGLCCFGLTTVLLNLHNAGVFDLNASILAMGLFYGGATQIIAGMMEWKKNNTFATTAFCSYGAFWIVLVGLIVLPKLVAGTSAAAAFPPANAETLAWFMTLWGGFSAVLFIGTFRLSVALQVVFGSLVVLFALLAAHFFLENAQLGTIAGYEGIFCGLSAIYTGLAQVLNEVYKKTVLPIGPVVS